MGDFTGRGLTEAGKYDLSQFGRYVRFRTHVLKGPRFEGEKARWGWGVKQYAFRPDFSVGFLDAYCQVWYTT